jgi:dipeptide/tripeptide permease
MGETISHTGYVIILLQLVISWLTERFKPVSSFITGLLVLGAGFVLLAVAGLVSVVWVFPGIFLVAIGEMISSPRIQEYITWIAPREKAGLYMGTNFLATGLGGLLSGVVYTSGIFRMFENSGHPQYVWLVLAAHMMLGVAAMLLFTKFAGLFNEQES